MTDMIAKTAVPATVSLQLGQIAPDFEQDSTSGPIRFHEWLGCAWGILFSHPEDYAPPSRTERGDSARLSSKWEKSNLKRIGLSGHPLDSIVAWAADTVAHQRVDYPILADADKKVTSLYRAHRSQSDPALSTRAVFVIDPNKKIRLILTFAAHAVLDFEEILRTIDLQLSDNEQPAMPVKWRQSDPFIIPPRLLNEDKKARLPRGKKTRKPHLFVVQEQS